MALATGLALGGVACGAGETGAPEFVPQRHLLSPDDFPDGYRPVAVTVQQLRDNNADAVAALAQSTVEPKDCVSTATSLLQPHLTEEKAALVYYEFGSGDGVTGSITQLAVNAKRVIAADRSAATGACARVTFTARQGSTIEGTSVVVDSQELTPIDSRADEQFAVRQVSTVKVPGKPDARRVDLHAYAIVDGGTVQLDASGEDGPASVDQVAFLHMFARAIELGKPK